MIGKMAKKVADRIKGGLKNFQPIIQSARSRDINESDTVIIISDFLSEVLGWDKYSEITTEFVIRNTYCDLAVKAGDSVHFLVEVKAIGLELKPAHIKQAVDYAANKGVDWVVLTNGWIWQAHRVSFEKPINSQLVFELDILNMSLNDSESLYYLYLLSKEGIAKSAIEDYHEKAQVINRFTVSAIIRSESVVKMILRELKRLNKGVRLDQNDLSRMLESDVLKRDVVEGDDAEKAIKLVRKSSSKPLRRAPRKKPTEVTPVTEGQDIQLPVPKHEPRP